MSMTREEIIHEYEDAVAAHAVAAAAGIKGAEKSYELFKAGLEALRPVSREQVERIFPGCDFCNMADFGEFGFEITRHYAKICCALGSWRFPRKEQFLFCPKCGKPLTDEAVEMVMERLEALHENP